MDPPGEPLKRADGVAVSPDGGSVYVTGNTNGTVAHFFRAQSEPQDYVLCNRWGRRLDPSALRRRYKRACAAAGLRPVRLHGLRHAAGSLLARTTDPVFVRDFLGHAKLTTTDRYLSANRRPEELERLDRAFAPATIEPSGVAADAEPVAPT